MPALSNPDEIAPAVPRAPGSTRLTLVARVGVPVLVGVVLATALLIEGRGLPERDLQLYAPYAARPGRDVALRALVFGELDRPEGPELLVVTTEVALQDGAGRVLAETRLEPSHVSGMEGVLTVPPASAERLWLIARARVGEQELAVRRELLVSDETRVPEGRGRLLSPLQHYRAFDVRPEGENPPPAHLEPRVVGGACTPGHRCELLVWVGAPAAAVEVEGSPSVEPREPLRSPTTEGVARLALAVRGLEADLQLLARRSSAVVARRTVRLPVDQAMPAVSVAPRLPMAPARPQVRAEHAVGPAAIIVDAFRDGVWERTGSLAAPDAAAGAPVPFEPLGAGLWRLQVRTDPYESSSAAVRFVYVREPDADPRIALDALVQLSSARGWNDAFAAAVDEHEPGTRSEAEPSAAFMMAAGELELLPQPRPSSSYERAAAGAGERAGLWRWIAAAIVVLAGLLAGLVLLQQGMRASAEARRVLRTAGEPEPDSAAARRQQIGLVVGAAVFVVLLFVAVALFVVGSR